MPLSDIRVGCAGWGISGALADEFPGEGPHLARYARRFAAVEINSSFYRPHRAATYEKWAGLVPDTFRFAVKFPRAATHDARLHDADATIGAFAEQVAGLGAKLGPVLVQLPPSLAFEAGVVDPFFEAMRRRFPGPIVCEPRHASWFDAPVDALWERHGVSRVAADPARLPAAARVGGAGPVHYWRLHGSPRVYYDAYGPERLVAWAADVREAVASGASAWVILDNTAASHAAVDAMHLERLLGLHAPAGLIR